MFFNLLHNLWALFVHFAEERRLLFSVPSLCRLRTLLTALCCWTTLMSPLGAHGEEVEDAAEMFSAWQERSSTTSRAPRPLSQTPQNVTVITAREIELLNAHTLADVLDAVPGIQLNRRSGIPGLPVLTQIQSTDFIHSQVFVDGVSASNLNSNYPDVAAIPAQIIERIEIVKGAASTAWGSALGGVINVITKSPEARRAMGGSVTASIGEGTTADTRGELSGSVGSLGYYLSGGYLGSEGLLPGMHIGSSHAYTKLTYSADPRTRLWGTFSYNRAVMGDSYIPQFDLRDRTDKTLLLASVGLSHTLREGLELEITGRHSFMEAGISLLSISDGSLLNPLLPAEISKDYVSGASLKLIWRTDNNQLVAGSDYNHQETYFNSSNRRSFSPFTSDADRWGLYLNDTYSRGPFSLSPGLRLDHTQTNGDNLSYSLGGTWQVSDSTLLRAYTGRGYGLPFLWVTPLPLAKIWTTQVGVESGAVPYLWLKGTLFRNMTWGAAVQQQLAMGSELEIRTSPVFNTSLTGGYTFTQTTRTSDGTPVRQEKPTHTLKLALRYDDATFRGVLTGSHIYWNNPVEANGSYRGLIWDLHLGTMLLKRQYSSLELFFSAHNLFNGNFNSSDFYSTVNRWYEGGVQVRF